MQSLQTDNCIWSKSETFYCFLLQINNPLQASADSHPSKRLKRSSSKKVR